MTNEDKDLRISYMVYAWAIDHEDGVEDQFLDWYQCREDVVPGETHYKAILDVARVRSRSYQRGYRSAGDVGRLEVNPKLGDRPASAKSSPTTATPAAVTPRGTPSVGPRPRTSIAATVARRTNAREIQSHRH